ncbi:hypothetical protein LAD12857_00560 [Lacrimispora amygdalina]|uniref:KAP NTPase domain-containing protein n=1 Tax=Lacrimispora amygdalina TaxID=253257 RepID=A0ABQ5LZD9_9FIRM
MDYTNLKFEIDDTLDRKKFVENIMNVIEKWNNVKHENNSLVISLDAPWGSGKSYLINMWKNWLLSEENADKNYYITYYNAWENDDNDSAFIPLVYKLQDLDVYKGNDDYVNNVEEITTNFLKSCGVALLKDGVKKYIGESTANILCKGIDGAAATKKIVDFFSKYKTYIDEKNKFKEALKELIPKDGKLIIFIDELDRCRPTFAIETLEITKHYFNQKDIVFIFAIDLEQLSYSISTMYGAGMDSAGYLRRFFDFNIRIPAGNLYDYIDPLYNQYFKSIESKGSFNEMVVNMFLKLNLSLRDIDKIFNNFIVFYLYYQTHFEHISENMVVKVMEVYLYFMTLKYKFPDIYSLIINKDFIAYDNAPKNWYVLEYKYFVSDNISTLLKRIQTGANHGAGNELISTFGLKNVNCDCTTFSQHIERTIEMFV